MCIISCGYKCTWICCHFPIPKQLAINFREFFQKWCTKCYSINTFLFYYPTEKKIHFDILTVILALWFQYRTYIHHNFCFFDECIHHKELKWVSSLLRLKGSTSCRTSSLLILFPPYYTKTMENNGIENNAKESRYPLLFSFFIKYYMLFSTPVLYNKIHYELWFHLYLYLVISIKLFETVLLALEQGNF